MTTKSKEKDARLARLEKEHKKARERIEELERLVAAADKPAQRARVGVGMTPVT